MMERFSTHYKTRFFPVIMDLFNQLQFEYKALMWCYSIPEEASACCRFASHSQTERKALFARSVELELVV